MPKKKIVGSGLTSREVEVYSVDETLPPFPTIRDELQQIWSDALECLRRHDLPDQPGCYAVDPEQRWQRLKPGKSVNCQALFNKGYHEVRLGYWDGGAVQDSPPWLAVRLLTKIQQFEHAIAENDWLSVQYFLLSIGQLKERLFWKASHEPAAQKGYTVLELQSAGRKKGMAANHQKRLQRDRELVELIQSIIDDASKLSPRAIARLLTTVARLRGLDLPKSLEKKVRSLRDAGLIEVQREKKKVGKA